MRSRTANWLETKIKYDKTMEDGQIKTVTQVYVVDSLTFAEAEEKVMEEVSCYISGDYTVLNIKKTTYSEIFFSDDNSDDKWYKAKLQFITIDEQKGQEKRQNVYYLVQAGSLQKAVKYIDEEMGKTMNDYIIASIAETTIMDVYEHALASKNTNPEPAE